jgi:formylglycine-generating enzyme required for sulfatase activity
MGTTSKMRLTAAAAAALVAGAIASAIGLGVAFRGRNDGARCGPGFASRGARCVVAGGACPPPLVGGPSGCDAPSTRVLIPASTLALGSSDWEAEGRVASRVLRVEAFRVDAFEVTRRRLAGAAADSGANEDGEPLRAASAVTRAEAAAFCARAGGHLPSEEQWIAAAAAGASAPRRYPWGDTGAVCRRAAWGLLDGPCAVSADGPDAVGAHPSGDSPLGVHDMAGNVAEWVAPVEEDDAGTGVVKGGSWQSVLASELRVWARLEIAPDTRDPRVGFRCVYAP